MKQLCAVLTGMQAGGIGTEGAENSLLQVRRAPQNPEEIPLLLLGWIFRL